METPEYVAGGKDSVKLSKVSSSAELPAVTILYMHWPTAWGKKK
jgi:hypothetical protein